LVTDALSLRNDLRDILTPALLAADTLLKHDPTVVKRAETMVKAVTRAVKRMGSPGLKIQCPMSDKSNRYTAVA
jgi:hypothetical protein